jgi:hypothetical protein
MGNRYFMRNDIPVPYLAYAIKNTSRIYPGPTSMPHTPRPRTRPMGKHPDNPLIIPEEKMLGHTLFYTLPINVDLTVTFD